MEGIYASAGSACSGLIRETSHVLKAIGLSEDYIGGTIRITMDETMTIKVGERVVQTLSKIINKLKV